MAKLAQHVEQLRLTFETICKQAMEEQRMLTEIRSISARVTGLDPSAPVPYKQINGLSVEVLRWLPEASPTFGTSSQGVYEIRTDLTTGVPERHNITLHVPPIHLRFSPGTLCVIDGLVTKPELNGKLCRIKAWKSNTGRYEVSQVHAGALLNLKPSNCLVCLRAYDEITEQQETASAVEAALEPDKTALASQLESSSHSASTHPIDYSKSEKSRVVDDSEDEGVPCATLQEGVREDAQSGGASESVWIRIQGPKPESQPYFQQSAETERSRTTLSLRPPAEGFRASISVDDEPGAISVYGTCGYIAARKSDQLRDSGKLSEGSEWILWVLGDRELFEDGSVDNFRRVSATMPPEGVRSVQQWCLHSRFHISPGNPELIDLFEYMLCRARTLDDNQHRALRYRVGDRVAVYVGEFHSGSLVDRWELGKVTHVNFPIGRADNWPHGNPDDEWADGIVAAYVVEKDAPPWAEIGDERASRTCYVDSKAVRQADAKVHARKQLETTGPYVHDRVEATAEFTPRLYGIECRDTAKVIVAQHSGSKAKRDVRALLEATEAIAVAVQWLRGNSPKQKKDCAEALYIRGKAYKLVGEVHSADNPALAEQYTREAGSMFKHATQLHEKHRNAMRELKLIEAAAKKPAVKSAGLQPATRDHESKRSKVKKQKEKKNKKGDTSNPTLADFTASKLSAETPRSPEANTFQSSHTSTGDGRDGTSEMRRKADEERKRLEEQTARKAAELARAKAEADEKASKLKKQLAKRKMDAVTRRAFKEDAISSGSIDRQLRALVCGLVPMDADDTLGGAASVGASGPENEPFAPEPEPETRAEADAEEEHKIEWPEAEPEPEQLVFAPEPEVGNVMAAKDAYASGEAPAVNAEPEETAPEFDFENLPWEVLLTKEAHRQLARLDKKLVGMVVKKIQTIGQGRWAGNSERKPIEPVRRIYESKFSKGGRIIWQIGIDYSEIVKSYRDTIRIWSINTRHDDAGKSIQNVINCHDEGSTTQLKKLLKGTARVLSNSKDVLPVVYSTKDDVAQSMAVDAEQFPPAKLLDDNRTLVKFYQLSNKLVEHTLAGALTEKMEWPFRPDETESLIIQLRPQPPCGILLIGRSGTGKTTIAVHRLFGLLQAADDAAACAVSPENKEKLSLVFVTANPTLLSSVRQSVRALQHADGPEPPLPPTLSVSPELAQQTFPLFLTATCWIRMLDGTLKKPFYTRDADGNITERINEDGMHAEAGAMLSLDDWDSDDDYASDEEELEDAATSSTSYATRAEVTFEMFEDELWPHMVTKQQSALRKVTRSTLSSNKQVNVQCEFAPSVVWTEIISFIKGSANSLDTENGSLSREGYCSISAKMAPNVANIPNGRERIYQLFEKYEFLKRNLGLFDAMDVTHHIFKQLKSDGYSGVTIHGFVIDEVQDFTQAQLRLFMMVASDPNFMFMTGDTCQTIARGVGFRFEDLRSMFYHLREKDKRIQVPELTKLEVNYRTHNGILRCAGEVVNMIHHFFPNAVDKLAKDRGHFEGSPPKILSAVSHDDLAILLIGSDVAHSQIEFGAHQAVIVRDQQAKDTLPEEFDEALVLTVFECKGLEFDDVFIVNFFKDSPASAEEWRVLYQFMLAEHQDSGLDAALPRFAPFNLQKHGILCEELKMFYTALTRARVNVVIHDESEDKREPMFDCLSALDLVTVFDSSSPEAIAQGSGVTDHRGMAVSSTKEEWKARGDNLMSNRIFKPAEMCYRKSGDKRLELKARGYKHVQSARKANKNERTNRLRQAALCFLECDDCRRTRIEAAKFLTIAGEFLYASEVYLSVKQWSKAAKQLEKACADGADNATKRQIARRGAEAYENAGELTKAGRLLVSVRDFDHCKQLFSRHPRFVPSEDMAPERLIKLAAEDYLRSDRFDRMLEVLSSLNIEQQLFFLAGKAKMLAEECERLTRLQSTSDRLHSQASRSAKQLEEKTALWHRIITGQVDIYERDGQLSEAASIEGRRGNLQQAARILQQSSDPVELEQAGEIALRILHDTLQPSTEWPHISLGVPDDSATRIDVDEICSYFKRINSRGGDALAHLVAGQALRSQEYLNQAEEKFQKLHSRLGAAACLCTRLQIGVNASTDLIKQIELRDELARRYADIYTYSNEAVDDAFLMLRNIRGKYLVHATNFTCTVGDGQKKGEWPAAEVTSLEVVETVKQLSLDKCFSLYHSSILWVEEKLQDQTLDQHFKLQLLEHRIIWLSKAKNLAQKDRKSQQSGRVVSECNERMPGALRDLCCELHGDIWAAGADCRVVKGSQIARADSITRCLASSELRREFRDLGNKKYRDLFKIVFHSSKDRTVNAFLNPYLAIMLYQLVQLTGTTAWLVRKLTREVEPRLWKRDSVKKGTGSFYMLGRLRCHQNLFDPTGQQFASENQHFDLVQFDTDKAEALVTNVRSRNAVEFRVPMSTMEILVMSPDCNPLYERIEHLGYPCLPLRGLLMANESAGGPLVFLQHAALSVAGVTSSQFLSIVEPCFARSVIHTVSIQPLVPHSLASRKTSNYITDNPRLLWVLVQSAFDVYNREFCDDAAVPKNTGPVSRGKAIARNLVLCLMLCVNMGAAGSTLGVYGNDDKNGSVLNIEPLLAQRIQHWLSEAVQFNLLDQLAAEQTAREELAATPAIGRWQWSDDCGWCDYSQRVCQQLEAEFSRAESRAVVDVGGGRHVDTTTMTQFVTSSPFHRRQVQRLEPSNVVWGTTQRRKLIVDLSSAAKLCRYFLKSLGDDVSESWRDDTLLHGRTRNISFHLAYEENSGEYEKLCQQLGQLGSGNGFNTALVRKQRLEFAAVVCQNMFRAARARRANLCATVLQTLCRQHLARSRFLMNLDTQEQSRKHGAGILRWMTRYQDVEDNVLADIKFCFCCGADLADEWKAHLSNDAMHFVKTHAFKEYTRWFKDAVCPMLANLDRFQEEIVVSKGVLAELLDAAATHGANSKRYTTLQELISRADNLETKLRSLATKVSRMLDEIDAGTDWAATALRHVVETAFPPLKQAYARFKVQVDAKCSDPQRANSEGDREEFRSANPFSALMPEEDGDDSDDDEAPNVRRSADEEQALSNDEEEAVGHWVAEYDAGFDDGEGAWEQVSSRKARKSAKRKGGGGGGAKNGGRGNRGNKRNTSRRDRGKRKGNGRAGQVDAGAPAAAVVRGAAATDAVGQRRQRPSDGGRGGHQGPKGAERKGRGTRGRVEKAVPKKV